MIRVSQQTIRNRGSVALTHVRVDAERAFHYRKLLSTRVIRWESHVIYHVHAKQAK